MNIDLDIFRDAAARGSRAHDAYTAYKKDTLDRTGKSIDGSVSKLFYGINFYKIEHLTTAGLVQGKKIPVLRLARNEVFEPADATNMATEALCVKLCQEWAKGMREGLHSTPQKEHLSSEDGMYSAGNVTETMRADLAASDTVNDMSERAFALFTHIKKLFGTIGHSVCSALASGKMNGHVVSSSSASAGKAVGSMAKGSTVTEPVLIDQIPKKESIALFEYARTGVKPFKIRDDGEIQGQLRENLKAFNENVASKFNLTADKYGRALEFHAKGVEGRIRTVAKLRAALAAVGSENKQLDLLKLQLNIVVIGNGWAEYKAAWSCCTDTTVGSLKDLKAKTEAMITASGKTESPEEPPVPDSCRKTIPSLGTLTMQASQLLARKQASAAELRQRVKETSAERTAKAESKLAARRDEHANAQPPEAPAVEVGMRLEVFAVIEDENEAGEPIEYKQWMAVEVISSAVSQTGKGKAAKGARRAPDWYLVKYECDGEEEWLRLKDFNCNSKGSWRLDLDFHSAEGGGSSSRVERESFAEASGASSSESEDDFNDEDEDA